MKTFIFSNKVTGKDEIVFYRKTYEGIWIHYQGETSFHLFSSNVSQDKSERKKISEETSREVKSFLPGKILDIKVKVGDEIKKGDVLLVLEAMKMEYEITSKKEGKIEKIFCKKDEQVSKDSLLLKIE